MFWKTLYGKIKVLSRRKVVTTASDFSLYFKSHTDVDSGLVSSQFPSWLTAFLLVSSVFFVVGRGGIGISHRDVDGFVFSLSTICFEFLMHAEAAIWLTRRWDIPSTRERFDWLKLKEWCQDFWVQRLVEKIYKFTCRPLQLLLAERVLGNFQLVKHNKNLPAPAAIRFATFGECVAQVKQKNR